MEGVGGLAGAAACAERSLVGGLVVERAAVAGAGALAEQVACLAALQRVLDVVSAAQELVVARVAAIECEWAEDGTVVERHRGLGHVSVDAAGVVAGVLGCTAVRAEAWVRAAVRRAGDGRPGTAGHTGLGGLHEAMAAGRLDPYRAGVVTVELEEAPAPVAAAVVAALDPWLAVETGPQLRRRVRRMLARVSPDLLRQRARRARSECRLERWASEPGVDCWHGTFPSEEAAAAWAAVDALAQRYVADGTCERVDRARAKALTDLVTGNATVEVAVVLTVPQGSVTDPATTTADAGHPDATTTDAGHPDATTADPGHPDATADPGHPDATADPERPDATTTTADADAVAGKAGRPGATAGPGGPEAAAGAGPAVADGGTAAARGVVDTGEPVAHPEDLVEVPGLRAGEPLLVPRAWLEGLTREAAAAAAAPGASRRARRRLRVRACHPTTGALADDLPDTTGSGGAGPGDPGPYRPPRRLAELVRARDRHCRFPGCHVAAVFCDLDHVRPWPAGPTTAANLVCLCRRHHRVKQRPGWTARLHPDATLTWTDPTGRTRTTHPPDALHPLVPPHHNHEPVHVPHQPRLDLPEAPHSTLEFTLEHLLATTTRTTTTRTATPGHRPRATHPPRDSLPDDPPF